MPVDVKTSSLPVKTTIADTDYVVIVDESGSPVTKKITVANFLANVVKTAGGATISGNLVAGEFLTADGYIHKQSWVNPLANSPIHALIPFTSGTQHITTAFTQPDFARGVALFGGQTGQNQTITVQGTDIRNNALSVNIQLNDTSEVDSIDAFKTITQLTLPPQNAPGDTLSISTTSLFGLDRLGVGAALAALPDGNTIAFAHASIISRGYATLYNPDGNTAFSVFYISNEVV